MHRSLGFAVLSLVSFVWNALEAGGRGHVAETRLGEGPGWGVEGGCAGLSPGDWRCQDSQQAQSGEWRLMVPILGSPGSRDCGGIRCGRTERGLHIRERALRKPSREMKTAGVCSILMGNRTQWGWREVGAAEGEEPRWLDPGCLGAVCRARDPACGGWGEGRHPVRRGLRNHSLALVWTLVKAGSLAWAVRMGCVKTFGVTGTALSDYSHFSCAGPAGWPSRSGSTHADPAWTVRDQ